MADCAKDRDSFRKRLSPEGAVAELKRRELQVFLTKRMRKYNEECFVSSTVEI